MSDIETDTYEEPSTPMPSPEPPAKKQRVKRAPTAYNQFVKETYSTLTDIPAKERFAACSKLWKEKKEATAAASAKPKSKKRVKKST